MKRNKLFILGVFAFFLAVLGCSTAGNSSSDEGKVEIMVSAAASLTDALEELKSNFEREHQGITVTYSFGSSGNLAQQIEQGAPAALFLSASTKDMDTLQDKGLLIDETRIDFAQNELVLIASQDSELNLSSFAEIATEHVSHFAIGDPESVPVGRYTKEVLEQLGLWAELQDKLVLGSDVRQVLTYVESGNAELGVVYSSDAFISEQVKVLVSADAMWHTPIVYPGAILANIEHEQEARAFLTYLTSEEGKEILAKYGFK